METSLQHQIKTLKKKSTKLMKKYGSIKAVSSIFGEDFIDMLNFTKINENADEASKVARYKEELRKDN